PAPLRASVQQTGCAEDFIDPCGFSLVQRSAWPRHDGGIDDAEAAHGGFESAYTGCAAANAALGDPNDFEEAAKALLFFSSGGPIAVLCGLPQAHIAMRVDVGDARNDTVSAHQQGIVDDDLGAGHQEDILVGGEIEQRIAEIAVVAA